MRAPGLGGANTEEVRGVAAGCWGCWWGTGATWGVGVMPWGHGMRVRGEYGCAEGGRATAGPHGGVGQPPDGGTSSGTSTLPSMCVQFIEELEMKRGMDLFKLSI